MTARLVGDEVIERSGIRMRRMAAADLAAVMELKRRSFRHPWSEDLMRRELTHDWSTVLLAQDAAGTLLGFVIVWKVHDEIHVLNVAVDPPFRRRGVARVMIEEVLERARSAGARLATLEVRRGNDGARALYEGMGFRAVGVRPNYYSDEGEDAVVMILELG